MESSVEKIIVIQIVRSPICTLPSDGIKLKDAIEQALSRSQKVIVSFSGIRLMISAFLNFALGRLYENFNSEELNKRLKLEDINEEQLKLVREVMRNAKVYYNDPENFDEAVKDILGGV